MQVLSQSTCHFSIWRIHQLRWQFPLFPTCSMPIATSNKTLIHLAIFVELRNEPVCRLHLTTSHAFSEINGDQLQNKALVANEGIECIRASLLETAHLYDCFMHKFSCLIVSLALCF